MDEKTKDYIKQINDLFEEPIFDKNGYLIKDPIYGIKDISENSQFIF